MSVSLTLHASEIDEALVRLKPILDFEPAGMMEDIAALGESQTRRRITDEKTAPDGTPWPPNWKGSSILHETGRNLLDSVASSASSDVAEWGASWEFAHVHQDGMEIVPVKGDRLAFFLGSRFVTPKKVTIPARPFVGISAENEEEIIALVTDIWGLAR
ncbi:phage virion morphogenesis protein [Amorphus sp. MBR-141]